jgi:hypothetical protein
VPDHDVNHATDDDIGFKVAVGFVGLSIVLAALFTLYFLLWDGGG